MAPNYYTGTVAVITGAASGIGRELARQAARRGAEVWACDIDVDGLAETQGLAEEAGQTLTTRPLDVSDGTAIEALARELLTVLQGRKLILVNNAGVALLTGDFHDTPEADMRWLFEVNYWGPLRLCKAFYPYFLQQNEGHIVNVSSVFGLFGHQYQSAYSPSKFALRGLTEVLRMELLDTGVVTTVVHPGGVDTGITRNARSSAQMAPLHSLSNQQFAANARSTPIEAARTILAALPLGKERVIIGSDARWIDRITRLLPVRHTRLFRNIGRRGFRDPYELLQQHEKKS